MYAGLRMRIILGFFLFGIAIQGTAQTVLWANRVLQFSSQYGTEANAASQALGIPDAIGGIHAEDNAWMPKRSDHFVNEYLQVAFPKAIAIQQVVIAQSKNPGAINKIYLIESSGRRHKVYEERNPTPTGETYGVFRLDLEALTPFRVVGLRLELKTKAVPGYNQIDAIGVSDSPEWITIQPGLNNTIEHPLTSTALIDGGQGESLPFLSADGEQLYFTRISHSANHGQSDLWVSNKGADRQWARPLNLGPSINTPYEDQMVGLSPDLQALYLLETNGTIKQLYFAQRQGRGWSFPQSVEIQDFDMAGCSSIRLSANGQHLLLSYDGDLFVSHRLKDVLWSRPEPLLDLNTASQEGTAWLAADDQSIYYSSNQNGHLDVYYSVRTGANWDRWTTPEPLPPSINTPSDEFALTVSPNGDQAYLVRDFQIKAISLPNQYRPKAAILFESRLIDSESGKPISGDLRFKSGSSEYPGGRKGETHQLVVPNSESPKVIAAAKGYFPKVEDLGTSEQQEELDFEDHSDSQHEFTSKGIENTLPLQAKIEQLENELRVLKEERTQSSLKQPERILSRPALVDEKPKTPSSGDEELDQLRSKLQSHYQKETPGKVPENVKESTKGEGDLELERLRKRYQNHYKEEKATPKTKTSGEVDETTYQQLQTQAIEDIQSSYIKDVLDDLNDEVYGRLETEVSLSLSAGVSERQAERVQQRTRQQILKQQASFTSKGSDPKITNLTRRQREALLEELRKELKPEVIRQLRQELRPVVQKELRRELEFEIKQQMSKELQDELDAIMKRSAARDQRVQNDPETYQKLEKDIQLIPLQEGGKVILQTVHFEKSRATLLPSSTLELEYLAETLKNHPTLDIEIGVHTHGRIDAEIAEELTEARAREIATLLHSLKAPVSQYHVVGFGNQNPIENNRTLEGRRANQRVEVTILKYQ